MKYINKFSTNADYQAFTEGGGYVTPNICYVEETNGIIMKEKEFSLFPCYLVEGDNGKYGTKLFEFLVSKNLNMYDKYYFSENEKVYVNNSLIQYTMALTNDKSLFNLMRENTPSSDGIIYINNNGNNLWIYLP